MFSSSVIDYIKATVCGVGISEIDLEAGRSLHEAGKPVTLPPPNIVGTGFFIGDRVMVTNRHVLDMLHGEAMNNRRLLAFHEPSSRDGKTVDVHYETKFATGLLSKGPRLRPDFDFEEDLALILLSKHVANRPSVCTLGSHSALNVGEPIAVCGYPWGSQLLHAFADPTMFRVGPVVTFGHVGALAPFDTGSLGRTTYIVADINTAPGMSGGPAFLRDGTCIGVHFGGHVVQIEDRNSKQHRLPQGFGFIYPLDSEKASRLLRNVQQDLNNPALFV